MNDVNSALTPLRAAAQYVEGGLNVIPLRTDGSKRPKIRWQQFTESRFPWFKAASFFASIGVPSGIGVICGSTSGNLEVLDFDDIECFSKWSQSLSDSAGLLRRLPVVVTPDNGRHVYYRCETIEGNQVLAQDEAANILAETRGQGGLVVAPGSPLSTHPTGRAYRLLQGELTAVPIIDAVEREHLLTIARSFNRYVRPHVSRAPTIKAKLDEELFRELYGDLAVGKPDERPGDIFNRTADWADILEPHGWTIEAERGETVYWRKPGSFGGEHHATTNYAGTDKLFVFSTAIPGFEAGRTYSKFFAYANLNFSGCCTAAAKHLVENKSYHPKGGPCTRK